MKELIYMGCCILVFILGMAVGLANSPKEYKTKEIWKPDMIITVHEGDVKNDTTYIYRLKNSYGK